MKKKELEIRLQQIPTPMHPEPRYEQYTTPAAVAADILLLAYQYKDIHNKTVIDLGCGTGIFSVGAKLLGAKHVIGIDIDKTLIHTAQHYAQQHNLEIRYLVTPIDEVDLQADTVIMNPPFGAQKANVNADRLFLEKAHKIAPITYSLHLTKTIPFIHQLLSSLKAKSTIEKTYRFPIKSMFHFHKKPVKDFEVTLVRIQRK
jgi:putative methylase